MDSSMFRGAFETMAIVLIASGVLIGIVIVGLAYLIYWLCSHISITWI